MEALRRATAAGDAFFAVDMVAAVVEDMGAMRADRRAVANLPFIVMSCPVSEKFSRLFLINITKY